VELKNREGGGVFAVRQSLKAPLLGVMGRDRSSIRAKALSMAAKIWTFWPEVKPPQW